MGGMSFLGRMLRAYTAFVVALIFLCVSACSPVVDPSHLEIVGADGVHHAFHIELAVKPEERERGLMYRQSIAADAGMLFDFKVDQMVEMWMKNTFIPLDMLFISSDGSVARIATDTVPQSLETISSGQPVRAVLEIKGGEAARQGIAVGAKVIYPLFGKAN
jgi:hypothetical protein